MKFLLIKIIFLAISISLVKSDCIFRNFTNNYQPLFFQKVHTDAIFVPANNNTISIHNGGSVQAYCSEGFQSFKVGNDYNVKTVGDKEREITVECRKSKIYLIIQDDTYTQDVILQCKKPTISLHSVRTYMCGYDDEAFIMNMEYNSQKLSFAEICYDFPTMQLKYIYHRAANMNPILSQQEKNSVITEPYHNPVEPLSNSLSISGEEIKSQTKLLLGSISGAVDYVNDHLVPLDSFDPFVTDSMDTISYLTKILWWKPLKEGNWRLFLDLLKKQSVENEYNVITGISGVAKYYQQNCGEYRNLKFEVNGLRKTAPKIIWSYLKLNPQQQHNTQYNRQTRGINDWEQSQNFNRLTNPQKNFSSYQRDSINSRYPQGHYSSGNAGSQDREVHSFVVIGYNTPFFEAIIKPEMDICGKIPWLRDLLQTSRMSTLGHIICHNYDVARTYIPELPTTYFGQLIQNRSSDLEDNKDSQSSGDDTY